MAVSLKCIKGAGNSNAYARGSQIYRDGGVRKFTAVLAGELITVSAKVAGSYGNKYETQVIYDKKYDDVSEASCECPAFEKYMGVCKHCVALLLKLRETQLAQEAIEGKPENHDKVIRPVLVRGNREIRTDRRLEELLYWKNAASKAEYMQTQTAGAVELEATLHREYRGWTAEFRIGVTAKYILKDIPIFLESIRKSAKVDYGKKLGFVHEMGAFTAESRKIISFLQECIGEEATVFSQYAQYDSYLDSYYRTKRYLKLSEGRMAKLLECFSEGVAVAADDGTSFQLILDEDPCIQAVLNEAEDGFTLMLPVLDRFIGRGRMYVRMGKTFYRCSDRFREEMADICGLVKGGVWDRTGGGNSAVFPVGKRDMNVFCGSILPALEKFASLTVNGDIDGYRPRECVLEFYLDKKEGAVTCSAWAKYGDETFRVRGKARQENIYRDIAKERGAYLLLKEYFTDESDEGELSIGEDDEGGLYRLASTGFRQIGEFGEIFISDALSSLKVLRTPKFSVNVSLKGGILDIEIGADTLPREELTVLLESYRQRKKYHRLKSGEFLSLEDSSAQALAKLADGLDAEAGALESGRMEAPAYRSFYVDQILRECEKNVDARRDKGFKALIRSMKDVGDSDYEIPENFGTKLRPYQKFGYRWLMTLADMGFGGILADDMGLGKTVQAIAFILKRVQDTGGKFKTMIVSPASLVYNWENEFCRFAPKLRITAVTGGAQRRRELIEELSSADVLLTSYDLLKRDVEAYRDVKFDCVILDEAQNIKNQATQSARAVNSLDAGIRFAMTGTPIENSLGELWSIFHFLMPGLLGAHLQFKRIYESPIALNGDEAALRRLQKTIRPFILRRLKSEVLRELPEKTETVIYSKMEEAQRKLYMASVQKLLDGISRVSDEEFKKNKIQILAGMTRLRRMCCDPAIVFDNYRGGSAKVDTCMELVESATRAGNKILLFSQFTDVLEILERKLSERRIRYHILTGRTPKERRMTMVQEFNRDCVPVFLISLRAGGTGLNLTAASIVIHFDPWWNEAAQSQATDRAHRFGQSRTVTVFKLIVKDTLEEKIEKLQQKKAVLTEQVMEGGSLKETMATREDFMEILRFD